MATPNTEARTGNIVIQKLQLIAGIVIAPILKRFGVDVVGIQHFAEFGVVMMLFLVGLELEPRMLWNMRNRLLGLGGLMIARRRR